MHGRGFALIERMTDPLAGFQHKLFVTALAYLVPATIVVGLHPTFPTRCGELAGCETARTIPRETQARRRAARRNDSQRPAMLPRLPPPNGQTESAPGRQPRIAILGMLDISAMPGNAGDQLTSPPWFRRQEWRLQTHSTFGASMPRSLLRGLLF